MRALTVKQPWAHAIFHLGKDVENRSRPTNYRGTVAIHVAKNASKANSFLVPVVQEFSVSDPLQKLEYLRKSNPNAGCIIGMVDIVDCVQNSESVWAFSNHYQWLLENPVLFDKPIKARGQLGLWNWNEE